MKFNSFFEIGLSKLPYDISEKDIIYVESEYNESVNRFIQMYYDEICENFSKKGYNFIYFPRLSEEIVSQILDRIFPDYDMLSSDIISFNSNFMLGFLVDEFKQYYYGPSFLYFKFPPYNMYNPDDNEEEGAYFCADIVNIEDFDDFFRTNDLTPILNEIDDQIQNWEEYDRMAHNDEPDYDMIDLMIDEDDIFEDNKDMEQSEAEIRKLADKSKEKVKTQISEINKKIKELNQCDRDNTIFRYFLRRELKPINRISDIRVTAKCEILLPDYEMELKLPSIYKAFYLLYLNHPEGINYQIVSECRDELVQWYRWSNPRNTDVSKIDKILAPREDNRNPIIEIFSRIKGELTKSLGAGLAKKYCISQNPNGNHCINTNGYMVKIEKENPFKIDMSATKKQSFN